MSTWMWIILRLGTPARQALIGLASKIMCMCQSSLWGFSVVKGKGFLLLKMYIEIYQPKMYIQVCVLTLEIFYVCKNILSSKSEIMSLTVMNLQCKQPPLCRQRSSLSECRAKVPVSHCLCTIFFPLWSIMLLCGCWLLLPWSLELDSVSTIFWQGPSFWEVPKYIQHSSNLNTLIYRIFG